MVCLCLCVIEVCQLKWRSSKDVTSQSPQSFKSPSCNSRPISPNSHMISLASPPPKFENADDHHRTIPIHSTSTYRRSRSLAPSSVQLTSNAHWRKSARRYLHASIPPRHIAPRKSPPQIQTNPSPSNLVLTSYRTPILLVHCTPPRSATPASSSLPRS